MAEAKHKYGEPCKIIAYPNLSLILGALSDLMGGGLWPPLLQARDHELPGNLSKFPQLCQAE